MIYLVTGHMRTGTSMMMAALTAGGIEPVYSATRDAALETQTADDLYSINPCVYEPSQEQVTEVGFPRMHDGKCLKMLWGGLGKLAPADYRVVFMWRDPEEIRQSYEGAFVRASSPPWLIDGGYEARMNIALDHLRNRRDVHTVTELRYREVLADPIVAFGALKADGWPLDVSASAAVVDPGMCRFKREELLVGI